MNPAKPRTSTAAALRDGERRFARRGAWLVLLLGLLAAVGPALAHILGVGLAVLLTAGVFSFVFLAMLAGEQVHGQLAQQAQDLLSLAGLHNSAIGMEFVDPQITAAIRIRRPAPAPRVRARALAALTLTPRLLPRPAATRAPARS